MVLQDYIYCRQIIYGILRVFTYNHLKRKVNFIWSFAIEICCSLDFTSMDALFSHISVQKKKMKQTVMSILVSVHKSK